MYQVNVTFKAIKVKAIGSLLWFNNGKRLK